MNILIACNEKYLDLSKYMLYSLSLYNDDLNIYLIHEILDDKMLDEFSFFVDKYNIGNLNVIKFDSSMIDLPLKNDKITGHITKEAYFRLYAPFFLPSDLDRILYLDCDIICIDNIDELYWSNFNDNIIVGCVNVDLGNGSYNDRLNLPKDNLYINSGVLLFNLLDYRKNVSIDSLNEFIIENASILDYQDQDVVNKMLCGHIGLCPIDYNFQITTLLYPEGGKIIHYTGPNKPWYDDYNMPDYAVHYYNILNKLNMNDVLVDKLEKHKSNFKRRLKKCSLIISGNIIDTFITSVLLQSEKDIEFIFLCDSYNYELFEKYKNDCRARFVLKDEFNIDDYYSDFIGYLDIELFKNIDINFFRELLYFGQTENLGAIFYNVYSIDVSGEIITLDKKVDLNYVNSVIKNNAHYNCIYRRFLEEKEYFNIGYWEII